MTAEEQGKEPEPWTTERIREGFIYDGGESEFHDPINGAQVQRRVAGAIFDRWLAAERARLRAEVEAERGERIVSTVEELEALPDGSVVRDGSPHRDVFEKAADYRWMMTREAGLFSDAFIVLPARVIDVPVSPAVEGAESE